MPAPPPEPDAIALTREMARYTVYNAFAARRVLYTWTTEEQLRELAAGGPLLSREQSDTRGPGYYNRVLARRAARGDEVARMFLRPAFARARHAWPSAWPTRMGADGGGYGPALLRLTLRPEAVIASLDTATMRWSFMNLAGRSMPLAEAVAQPEHIAAVYFVNAPGGARSGDAGEHDEVPLAHREYVVCNESMVESWEVYTDATRAEVQQGIEALERLRRVLAAAPASAQETEGWNAALSGPDGAWTTGGPQPGAARLYEGALAFANEFYRPDETALAALVARLRAAPQQGASQVVRPRAAFEIGPGWVPPGVVAHAASPPPAARPRAVTPPRMPRPMVYI